MTRSLPFDASTEPALSPEPAELVPPAAPAPDFETALAQLESLVARMEDGDLPLEQSLAAYQEGTELARLCQSLLDEAEARVKVLQNGTLVPYSDGQDGG